MSDTYEELFRKSRELIESITALRAVLLDYQNGCEWLLDAAPQGRRAGSAVEGVELLNFAELRERLAAALNDFEAARRSARIGLIAVAEEEGSNLSDVARALGVSRQLLSRQAIEGRQED